jgi:hypothetical protein
MQGWILRYIMDRNTNATVQCPFLLTPFLLLFCHVRLLQCLCFFHHCVGLSAYVTSLFTLLTPSSIYPAIHFSVQINPPALCPTNKPVNLFLLNPFLIGIYDDCSMYD